MPRVQEFVEKTCPYAILESAQNDRLLVATAVALIDDRFDLAKIAHGVEAFVPLVALLDQ